MRLDWDRLEDRKYENGVDHGVLYPQAGGKYPKGVAWSGLTSVNENPSGAEETKLYADNIPYLSLRSTEELGLAIECLTYPDEWKECDGSKEVVPGVTIGQQARQSFGMCYRTKIGNAVTDDLGYKLHLAYGCSASPSERSYQTVNESPEAMTASYDISTVPVVVPGYKPTSLIVIDSTKIDEEVLTKLENILYGDDDNDARLPLPDEIISLFDVAG